MASDDPTASPSGRTWDEIRNFRPARIASTMRAISGVVVAIMHCGVELIENLFDAILAGDGVVVDEDDFGRAPQAQPGADLAAEEWRRALERAAACRAGFLVAERGVEHPRLLKIGSDFHARQRDETNARIVYFAGQQIGELASDLIGDSVGTRSLGHYAVIATRSLKKTSMT